MDSRHQVRPVCPYWLLVVMFDRHTSDHDGHVCSFVKVPIGSLGEDLENITNAISTEWWNYSTRYLYFITAHCSRGTSILSKYICVLTKLFITDLSWNVCHPALKLELLPPSWVWHLDKQLLMNTSRSISRAHKQKPRVWSKSFVILVRCRCLQSLYILIYNWQL